MPTVRIPWVNLMIDSKTRFEREEEVHFVHGPKIYFMS